ncbi:tryptophan synthase subunit alpha [Chlamydiota bacterium]
MNRIDAKFKQLKEEKKKGFIAYITGGDPDIKTTVGLVESFAKQNVDLVEIGVPFSDPMADGPVNQRAAERALAGGITLKKILTAVENIRKKTQIPIVLFTYFNPVFQYGIEKFSRDAVSSGVDGILVVDLPPEEARPYQSVFKKYGLKTIYLVAPTSGKERIKMICNLAEGFVYAVSRTGVTGTRKEVPKEIKNLIENIRKYTVLPIAVGFGVSNRMQVETIQKTADAVVVGSAIVNKIAQNMNKPDLLKKVVDFVSKLIP